VDRHGVQRRTGDTAEESRRVGAAEAVVAEAILADGRSVELETFACFFDWFGNTFETQIAASDGEYPLLGTMLLDGHRLETNYAAKTVELT
jgi:hypothetical protein